MNVPDHADLVASIKAQLVARGVSLVDGCGAFEITKRVAWQLRTEGAGLLDKPAGNNCQGYSVDTIVYPDGTAKDILISSGGENGPAWNDSPQVDPSRFRPPIDPGDAPVAQPAPPADPQPPAPVPIPFPPDRLDALIAEAELVVAGLTALRDGMVALSAKIDALEKAGITAHLRF